MNREILFKAKRIDNGEWAEGMPLFYQDGSMTIYSQKQAQTVGFHIQNNGHCDRNTLCQCTGLNDKNGKLIWENDIVSVEYLDLGKRYKENAEVSYSKNGFVPFSWEYECDGCDLRCEILEVEVVGNKFDNPEFLEGGAEK